MFLLRIVGAAHTFTFPTAPLAVAMQNWLRKRGIASFISTNGPATDPFGLR